MARRASALFGWTWLRAALAAALGSVGMMAQEPSAPPVAATVSPTNMPLRQIAPGVFEIGKVRFDQQQKTVTFPAALNLSAGIIEYVLVTSYGKTHESLLRTEVEPYHIHLALLLLGAKGAGTNAFPDDPAKPLPGDRVTVELSWKKGRKELRRRAEELVYSRRTRSPMTPGEWIYNGSQVLEGTFVAQRDGSIISLITDPDALVNNPRPGHQDDENWTVSKTGLPAPDTPVQVLLRLSR